MSSLSLSAERARELTSARFPTPPWSTFSCLDPTAEQLPGYSNAVHRL